VDNFCRPGCDRATVASMTFKDLPPNWPSQPLTSPDLVHDVLDLCVNNTDRVKGGVSVLVLRDDLTLAQPIFVKGPLPRLDRFETLKSLFRGCSRDGLDGAFVVGIVHEAPGLSDDDRALHQDMIDVCAELGFRLVSTHLLCDSATVVLPVARLAA